MTFFLRDYPPKNVSWLTDLKTVPKLVDSWILTETGKKEKEETKK